MEWFVVAQSTRTKGIVKRDNQKVIGMAKTILNETGRKANASAQMVLMV